MADPLNPFNPYYPATAAVFANREREQAFFRQGLVQGLHPLGPGPWNVALLGPWGIGKTSLMRRFAEMTAEFEPPALAVSLAVTSALTDLGDLAATLLVRVHREIRRQQRWPERLRAELERWEPSIGLGPLRPARRSRHPEVADRPDLFAELDELWQSHLRGRVSGMVILLDDAHLLLTHDPSALLSLRAVFSDLQGAGARYPLVITGPEGLFEAVRDVSEPVTRFFERMALGPFSPSDTAEAVRGPLRALSVPLQVDDSAIRLIWELTGGHPFFVAFAMRDLVAAAEAHRARRIGRESVDSAWTAIAGHLAAERFAVEWQSATPAEREVLRAFAAERAGVPLTQAIGKSGTALLQRLLRKGLIVRSRRGEYHLYHSLFEGYVRGLGGGPPA